MCRAILAPGMVGNFGAVLLSELMDVLVLVAPPKVSIDKSDSSDVDRVLKCIEDPDSAALTSVFGKFPTLTVKFKEILRDLQLAFTQANKFLVDAKVEGQSYREELGDLTLQDLPEAMNIVSKRFMFYFSNPSMQDMFKETYVEEDTQFLKFLQEAMGDVMVLALREWRSMMADLVGPDCRPDNERKSIAEHFRTLCSSAQMFKYDLDIKLGVPVRSMMMWAKHHRERSFSADTVSQQQSSTKSREMVQLCEELLKCLGPQSEDSPEYVWCKNVALPAIHKALGSLCAAPMLVVDEATGVCKRLMVAAQQLPSGAGEVRDLADKVQWIPIISLALCRNPSSEAASATAECSGNTPPSLIRGR
jgi:hypothetical protein